MAAPDWALSLAYWLHMLATTIWIGGLAGLALLVLPAAQRSLDNHSFTALLGNIQKRLDPLGWFCLALLVATGLYQMSASPNYKGFLAINSTWSVAIFTKHVLLAVMVLVSAYLTWGVLPELRRAAMRLEKGLAAPGSERLQRRNLALLRLDLVLALLVLALTALARSFS